jgi:hypothetical protein
VKVVFACLLSALVVAAAMAVYSIVENGVSFEMLGVSLIGFVYALAIAFVIGVPCLYAAKKIGKTKPLYFAIVGGLVGTAFMIVPFVLSGGSDLSVLKTMVVLGLAGALAGFTFGRVSQA